MAVGAAVAFVFGYLYSLILNHLKLNEEIVGTFAGYAFIPIMNLFYTFVPVTNRQMLYPIGGQGLRPKVNLENYFGQILDRLWEHYELSHSDAQAQRIELESVPKANRRIGELKRDITALGTPNIGAIDEFQRVNTRYTYLTDQRNDVEKAKGELQNIIGEITEEMTKIFAEQFKLLSESFQTTFQELFGGGTARLELEDEEDILGCGIEIKAQPPGKTLKTISLLSGGEKAFVAIALYFSILKVHPTPFCVMDEIEAALDDANVTRYARYMRTLAGRTQFIVITHRRGTMEEADVLYGVTMQEQGVSKILTINLNDMAKELKIK